MAKTLPLLGVSLAVAVQLSGAARAAVLWDGDAGKGTAVFNMVEAYNGTITVVDDPSYGKVFKIVCNDNGGTKARSEVSGMAGFILDPSGDYYVGWTAKFGPLPTKAGKWQVLSQVHYDGPGRIGAAVPFGLSVPGDGKMHFNLQDPSSHSSSMWDHSLPIDSWHRYVMHTKMSETLATGVCELWFDGVKQTLTNGKETIPCAMSHANAGTHWKWGIYRSGAGGGIGQSVQYLARPMLGTTYEDVADGMGGGGSDGGTSGGGDRDAGAGGVDTDAGNRDAMGGTVLVADGGGGGGGGAGSSGSGARAGGGGGGRGGGGGESSGASDTDASDVQPPGQAGAGCGCRTVSAAPPSRSYGLLLLSWAAAVLTSRHRRHGQRRAV